ncbi:MAG TPA: EamA family transporter [Candidatus Binatia bacterium]|nr:EamA family transporter [Candidatus Binatia bacterium]
MIVLKSKPDSAAGALSLKLVLAFIAIYIIWGSTFLAIRYAVQTIPPLVTAGLRHSVAGTILFAWAWLRGFRPTRRQWVAGAVQGALFFYCSHGLLHWAERYVESGMAALLMATEAIFILLFGWVLGQEKINRYSGVGVMLGIAGVALLTGAELGMKGSSMIGVAAILISSVAWSVGVVLAPRLKLPDDALGRTALPTLCGAAMLLVTAYFTGEIHRTHWEQISLRSALGLGYLIVFGSVIAFTAYVWLLQRVPPTLVATHTYVNPVVAVLLGWLLAGEVLNLRIVLASTVILAAIVLVRRGERAGQSLAPGAVIEMKSSEECA